MDYLELYGLVGLTGFMFVAIANFCFCRFIALKARPLPRAAWTAGLAYLAASAVFLFGALPGWELLGPLLTIPGGLIAFGFWWFNLSRGWVEPHEITEDMVLENDDWRTGLLGLMRDFAQAAARTRR